MSDTLLTELADNGVLTITLNRPEVLNSLNETITLGLLQALIDARTNKDVRAIVITGAGRAFCAGADLDGKELALTQRTFRWRSDRCKYGREVSIHSLKQSPNRQSRW